MKAHQMTDREKLEFALAALADIAKNYDPGQGTRSGTHQAELAQEALDKINGATHLPQPE